jgi:hypothetical protein
MKSTTLKITGKRKIVKKVAEPEMNQTEVPTEKSYSLDDNVEQIGELGNKEDMIGGIDCKVTVDGKTNTVQIKPFSRIKQEDGKITVLDTGQVKKYSTDWMVFTKKNKEVLIFSNKQVKITHGVYVFPEESLIYTLN